MGSRPTPTFGVNSAVAPLIHVDIETCPTCGLEIPPEKLAEAKGRIAAYERDRTLAITSRLQKEFSAERDRADAKAAESLEAERAQSAIREAHAREKVEAAAELRLAEGEKNAEGQRAQLIAALERQKTDAESQRKLADEVAANLRAQMEELRRASALQMERVTREAKQREMEIKDQARQEAEKAATEANEKARQAEQRTSALEQELAAQREILEKEKEAEVNAEKARSFTATQKLTNSVDELKRALERKNAQELGEGAEVMILEALRAAFAEDKITRIEKGAPGADIRHIVMRRGKECGTILYDSKNHIQFRSEHVTKLRGDQLADKAEHAVLSLRQFPQGTSQIDIRDGVILANPARVVAVAQILRQHILQVQTLRSSNVERERKTTALYEFINSEQCSSLLDRVEQRAGHLSKLQEAEIAWHRAHWNKQGEAIQAIKKAKSKLEDEISSIIGTSGETQEED